MKETIIRCDEHLKNFTLIDNTCLRTSTLSMQAMGLFSYLMTLPSNWAIHKSELVNHFSNGRDAVYKAFNELVDNGFITFVEKKNEMNQFCGYEYYVHEKPVEQSKRSLRKTRTKIKKEDETLQPDTEIPYTENPDTEKPYTENPSLLSTNKLSTNKLSTNKLNSNSHCCGFTATKRTLKKSTNTFKNEDYTRVFNAYYKNCKELFDKKLIKNERPVIPAYSKRLVKKAFENFGIENVVDAVTESINHKWLVEQQYPFSFIFGQNELPMLINKTYCNPTNYINLSEKIDLTDLIE